MEFRVLGPLQVIRNGVEVFHSTARKPRLVLAALLSEPDRPISVERLADVVWGQHPPRSARRNLQLYVHVIRNSIGAERIAAAADGYVISAGESLDAIQFERQAEKGIALTRAGDHNGASQLLHRALSLWRGDAFTEFSDSPAIAARAVRLEQLRLTARRRWFEAELSLGHHGDLLAELHDAAHTDPLDEEICVLLMLALFRSGRQAEALQRFRLTRTFLVQELGIEPGERLQEIHRQILAVDPQLTLRARSASPQQLPASSSEFVGRIQHLSVLDDLASEQGRPKSIVIAGLAGIGKTTLTAYWGRLRKGHFPDGQLYINLQGNGPTAPVAPSDVLAHFLRTLGVSGPDMPASAESRAGMFQTLIHDRRMLVLLDDAATAEQVRPLLPAASSCLAIITSRQTLAGLTATHGTRRLALDLLTGEEALDLLSRILGPARVQTDVTAAEKIASLCGHLPLALGIAAASLADQPTLSLASFVDKLANRSTLDMLLIPGDEQRAVRAAFASSYDRLDGATRQLFRMLGAGYSTSFSAETAASVAATALDTARQNLAGLQRMHLVEAEKPGRYSMHDLVYQYARELVSDIDGPQAHERAAHRALDHFVQSSSAASPLIELHTTHLQPGAVLDGVCVTQLATEAEAIDWFATEQHNLLAAVAFAIEHNWLHHVPKMVVAWEKFRGRQGYLSENVSLFGLALSAAERTNDLPAQAATARGLANTHILLDQLAEALPYAERALETYKALENTVSQGHTHLDLSVIHGGTGANPEALAHARAAQRKFRLAGSRSGQANASNNVGWYLAQLGQHDAGLAACYEALRINQEIGDLYSQAYTLDSIAYIYGLEKDWHQSISNYQAAVRTFERINDRLNAAVTLEALGDTHQEAGDRETARSRWQEALLIFEQFNHPKAVPLKKRLNVG